MTQKISPFFLAMIITFIGLYSTPSLANRCEWHQTFNQAKCCKANEQAIWNALFKRVECVASESGDSCAWDNRLNRIRCCESEEHAVWDQRLNRLQCFRF